MRSLMEQGCNHDIVRHVDSCKNKNKKRKKKKKEEEESDNDKENQQALSFYINKPVKETIFFYLFKENLFYKIGYYRQ